jgi:hypothetical protein
MKQNQWSCGIQRERERDRGRKGERDRNKVMKR